MQLCQAPDRRKVVWQGAGQLEKELLETMTIFGAKLNGLCLFHTLARVWNEMHPQHTRQTGQGIKNSLLVMMEVAPGQTVEGHTLAEIIREDGWVQTWRTTSMGPSRPSKH